MKIPYYVQIALTELQNAGYEAYIVGGAVRDFLLGFKPHDFDIATNALPEQIQVVFANYNIITTGIKHGTVGIIISKKLIEITTFRADEDYEDYRHPTFVRFVDGLKEDLSRRDFTINALAYNQDVIDYFDGVNDLNKKIIRCVGDPNTRFTEDVLRILRALRFSCQLKFTIDQDTKAAIFKFKDLLVNISNERIAIEINKMLLSDITIVLEEYLSVFQVIFPELDKSSISEKIGRLRRSEENLIVRTAILFYDFKDPEKAIDFLRPSKIFKRKVLIVITNQELEITEDSIELCKLLTTFYREDLLNIEGFRRTLGFGTNIKDIFPKILNKPTKVTDLNIKGIDLINLGISVGPKIAEILNELLLLVIEDRINNKHSELEEYVIKKYCK